MRKKIFVFVCSCATLHSVAQKDSGVVSFHFQQTYIPQWHPKFHSPYVGDNSLQPKEDVKSSLTTTFFFAAKPWKHGLVIVNPEIAGGTGLSGATGIAGFPNGEIFRVGNPKPVLYLARLVLEQTFPLKNSSEEYDADEANNVRGM